MLNFNASGAQLPSRVINGRIDSIILERFQGERALFLNAMQEEGLTIDEWSEQVREDMIVNILRNEKVFSKAAVAPRSVRELYEQQKDQFAEAERVMLQMMIINVPKNEDDRARVLNDAALLRARAVAGENFAELAKEFSEGPKAKDGGHFGWLKMNELKPEVAEAIGRREAGEVTELLDTGDQFYIVNYLDYKEGGTPSFEELEAQLRRTIKIKKRRRAL